MKFGIAATNFLLAISLAVLFAGCAGNTLLVGQSLDEGDTSLAKIDDALVVIMFSVESPVSGEYFRAADLWGTNTATGQAFRFPLFSNFIMGTADVPHTIEGSRLTQTVMLDLPAGSYSIDRIDFVTLEDHLDDSVDTDFINRPYPALVLEVDSGGVQYFGKVDFRILDVTKVGSEYRVDVRVVPRGSRPPDIDALKATYPALVGTDIQRKRIKL